MEQIALNIVRRIPYSPEDFILHSGVKEDFERCLELVSLGKSAFIFFHGASGSGKSHLSLSLEAALQNDGIAVNLIGPSDFENILMSGKIELPGRAVILIDDAHLILSNYGPGQSGSFVKFCELLRAQQNSLVLFSSLTLSEFSFDQHISSRLKSGAGFHIGAPAQDELRGLVRQMSLQRGLKLSPKKLDFIASRVARDPADIIRFLEERI